MRYLLRLFSIISLIIFSLLATGCGAGGSNAATTGGATDKWITKTSNHTLGSLEDQILLPMTNGDLYLAGSKLVAASSGGFRHEPFLAKSTDGGGTWSTASLVAPATATGVLYGFKAVSNGTKIILTGGMTSYGSAAAPPSYNNNIYAYTPSTNTWAAYDGTTLGTSFSQKTAHAMAYDGTNAIYISGGSFQAPRLLADGVTVVLDTYPSYRVWKSLDAGASWIDMTAGVTESANGGNAAIHKHCMTANGANLYLFGGAIAPIHTETTGPSIGSNFVTPSEVANTTTIRRSVNGGSTWTVVNTTFPEAPIAAACTQIGSTLYSSGGLTSSSQVTNVVRKSTDGGITWSLDASSALHGFRFAHAMSNRNGKVIVFGGTTAGSTNNKTDVIEATP